MQKRHFDFIKPSKMLLNISMLLTVCGLALIFTKGFQYGIDFTGGTEVQIQFKKAAPAVEDIRSFLNTKGYTNIVVQTFGESREILFRAGAMSTQKIGQFSQLLQEKWNGVVIRRVDSVGPQIGAELKKNGLLAICYSLLLILMYVGLRFDYIYAPSAVFCLFHDTILTMAVFALLGKEVNVQTLAAVLAIIGYSLNDTIVTFDRIRENVDLYSRNKTFVELCNDALNGVLSRTLLTSVTTLLAVGSMWLFTSGVIKDFAFTLGIGVVIGTYSSIFVATPLAIFFHKIQSRKKSST